MSVEITIIGIIQHIRPAGYDPVYRHIAGTPQAPEHRIRVGDEARRSFTISADSGDGDPTGYDARRYDVETKGDVAELVGSLREGDMVRVVADTAYPKAFTRKSGDLDAVVKVVATSVERVGERAAVA